MNAVTRFPKGHASAASCNTPVKGAPASACATGSDSASDSAYVTQITIRVHGMCV